MGKPLDVGRERSKQSVGTSWGRMEVGWTRSRVEYWLVGDQSYQYSAILQVPKIRVEIPTTV